jgi:hypothetical protein
METDMRRASKVGIALLSLVGAFGGTAAADTILSAPADANFPKFGPGSGGQNQFGQTITVPSDNVLKSFSFSIFSQTAGSFTFRGAVAAWDAANQRATGPLLYQSADVTAAVQTFTFTPNLSLTSGAEYVLFLNTTAGSGTANLSANFANAYSGGTITYMDNPVASPTLAGTWNISTGVDLAFTARFAAPETPLPGVTVGVLTLLSGVAATRLGRRRRV